MSFMQIKRFYLDENDENENDENDNDEIDENKNDEKFKRYRKVKDHWYYTGKFRGAAHNKFNFKYQEPKDILIVIHNVGYDTHFIINQ